MSFRTIKRRIKGHLLSAAHFLEDKKLKLKFMLQMHRLDLNDKYIWEAFSFFAGKDMTDPMTAELPDGSKCIINGFGMYLELKRENEHYTFEQNEKRQLVIHEWREEKRRVKMEYGEHETNWWEAYRSGRHINSPAFVYLLTLLYGRQK